MPRYFFAFLCSLLILFTASRAFLENWKCGQVKAVTMDILTVQLNLKAPLTIHGLGSSLFVLLVRHVCSVTWIFTIKLLGLVWLIKGKGTYVSASNVWIYCILFLATSLL